MVAGNDTEFPVGTKGETYLPGLTQSSLVRVSCRERLAKRRSRLPRAQIRSRSSGLYSASRLRHDNARARAAMLTIGLLAAAPAGASCSMGIVNVVFGAYNTLSASSLDGAGSVSVTCDVTSSFQVALNKGRDRRGPTTAERRQCALLQFVHRRAAQLIWGDGTVGTALLSGSGTAVTYTVYGRIPGGQNLPAGSYGDSITVTLDF